MVDSMKLAEEAWKKRLEMKKQERASYSWWLRLLVRSHTVLDKLLFINGFLTGYNECLKYVIKEREAVLKK